MVTYPFCVFFNPIRAVGNFELYPMTVPGCIPTRHCPTRHCPIRRFPTRCFPTSDFSLPRRFPTKTFPYLRRFPTKTFPYQDISLPRLFPTSDISLPRLFPTKMFPYQVFSLPKLFPTKTGSSFDQNHIVIWHQYCTEHVIQYYTAYRTCITVLYSVQAGSFRW